MRTNHEESRSGKYRGFSGTAKKRVPFFIFLSAFLVLLSSCSKPKIIPDEKLAQIFRDAYVSNAYTQNHRILHLDSLNIYEPIFAAYGYTTEDIQFTIGNFAKRKSARMSDVVDRAIEMLEKENKFYQRRVAIVDSIGQIARDRYAAVIYSDTLIPVRRIADTSKLRIEIPVDRPGTYDVSYYYLVDTSDHNHNLRVNHFLLDDRNRQSGSSSRRLKRFELERVTASFTAGEQHRKLVLDLNGYANMEEELTRPHLTIDTLVVTRYLPDREARDSMARELFRYPLIDSLLAPRAGAPRIDTLPYIFRPDETDLVALPADS